MELCVLCVCLLFALFPICLLAWFALRFGSVCFFVCTYTLCIKRVRLRVVCVCYCMCELDLSVREWHNKHTESIPIFALGRQEWAAQPCAAQHTQCNNFIGQLNPIERHQLVPNEAYSNSISVTWIVCVSAQLYHQTMSWMYNHCNAYILGNVHAIFFLFEVFRSSLFHSLPL